MAALQLASKPTSHLLLPAEAEFVDESRKFLDHRRRQGSFVLVCRANTVVLLAVTKEGNQANKKDHTTASEILLICRPNGATAAPPIQPKPRTWTAGENCATRERLIR
jgi:hypothetical protein